MTDSINVPTVERGFEYTEGKMYRTIKVTMPPCDTNDDAAWKERNELAEKISALLQAPAKPADCNCEKGVWCCKEDCPRTAMKAPAQPAQVQGWQWVPVEPTEEMIKGQRPDGYTFSVRNLYKAMLAAAPKPPVHEPVQEVDDLGALVRRLARALSKAAPDNDLPAKALDYLQRKGLQGSPLRDAPVQGWQMVLPKRIYGNPYSRGFNACLDKVALLNAAAPKPLVQEPVAWMLADAVGGSMMEFQRELLLEFQCRYGGEIVPLYAAPHHSDDVAKDAARFRYIANLPDIWSVIGDEYCLNSEHEGAADFGAAIDAAMEGAK